MTTRAFAEMQRSPVSFLLITSSYLPIIGGSEVEAQRVCVALRRRGYRMEILCPGGPPMPAVRRWTDACGLPVRIFGNHVPGRLRGRVFVLGVAWTLVRQCRGYRLVYFLMPGLQVTVGVLVARLLGKRVVMKFSGMNEIRKLTQSVLGRIQLKVLDRWTDCVMLLNQQMFDEAAQAGLKRTRLLWMPNPVDVDEFAPLSPAAKAGQRAALGLPAESPLIMYVGRLAPEKELDSLLRAFGQVRNAHPAAVLVLVGDGPARAGLAELGRRMQLKESLIFTGQVAVGDVRPYLQCADVFALVSSLEGFPVSLLEAMSVGLPSVVSRIPASTQLIADGDNGLVAEVRDEAAIAKALVHLLEDDSRRAAMGSAARRMVIERYSTEQIANGYEELFGQVLQR